ncbi:DNA-binding protein [Scytonema sp. NUACC26]|uniref:DNA-binding protein n=1 Tax=Scytonema sp. NUACC26 TaxID=3140176 RepID=UPI0034DBA267
MIKNEHQYQVSQERIANYKKTTMDKDEAAIQKDYTRYLQNRGALQCHIEQLETEIAEYETLINSTNNQPITIKVESFHKLPDTLIKARIAAKISIDELATMLGIESARVLEYEQTDYQCASFVEILEVITVLGIEFENATVRVDFEEIEYVKKVIEKWDKEKASATSKV